MEATDGRVGEVAERRHRHGTLHGEGLGGICGGGLGGEGVGGGRGCGVVLVVVGFGTLALGGGYVVGLRGDGGGALRRGERRVRVIILLFVRKV